MVRLTTRLGGRSLRRIVAATGLLVLASSFGPTAAWAGAFGTAQPVAGTSSLNALDCTSAHDCVAVGANAAGTGAVVPVTDGVPGTEQDVAGAPNGLSSIACVFGASDCVAAGYQSDLVAITGGAPAAHGPVAGIVLAAVACPPGSGACVGVGGTGGTSSTGEFVPVTGGAAGKPVSVPGTSSLSFVACSAVNDCLALGADSTNAQVEVQITNGAVAAPPRSLGLGAGQFTTGLACSAVDKCFAVGVDINPTPTTGLLVPITASGPGAVVAVAGLEQASGIACAPGAAVCIIVGLDTASQTDAAFVALDPTTGGVGTAQADGDPASVNSTNGFYGVGCSTSTTCFGVLGSTVAQSTEGFVVPITLTPPAIAPIATITTPANGATYSIGDPTSPKFAFGCSPGVGSRSTVTSCAGKVGSVTVATGDAIDTSAVGSFTLTVTATDSSGLTDTATSSYSVTAGAQTISFPQAGPFPNRQPPVQLSATASSGLAVTFSVLSGPCAASGSHGSTLTFTGPGSCAVEANQAGNSSFAAAPPVDRTIVENPPVAPSCSNASVSAFNGAATTFGLGCSDDPSDPIDPLTYTVVSGPAHGTLTGPSSSGVVTYTSASGFPGGSDSFTFKATNDAGDSNTATVSITVAAPEGPPTVTITTPVQGGSYPFDGPATFDFTCNPGSNGKLRLGSYGCVGTIEGGEVVQSGDQLAKPGTGSVLTGTVTLDVTATDTDGQTVTASVTYTVTKPQTITFPQRGPFPHGQAPVALKATASSGLPVTYSVVSGPCTVDSASSTLTFTGSGSCVVAADQGGDATFAAAPTVRSTIIVNAPTPPSCLDQSLSFPFGATQTITLVCSDAPGDAGDPLTYTVVTQPTHGTLTAGGTADAVNYTPAVGYSGADGFTFRAADAQGVSNTATVSIVVAPQAPPASTSAPGVSGTPAVGATLTCSKGVWSGGTPQTYAYQWLRDAVAIAGETNSTYLVATADQGHGLACVVTATNFGGTASATSPAVAIAPAPVTTTPPAVTPPAVTPPANAGLPVISGTAKLGSSLSCSPGAWSGTPPLVFAYQWKRDGTAIAGATGPTYGVATGDLGHSLTCAVAASNAAGTAGAQSQAVGIPLPSNAFTVAAKPKASTSGVITVGLQTPGAGHLDAVATFRSPGSAGKASTARASKSKVVVYGRGSTTAKGVGSFALSIRPTKAAVSLLKKRRRLRLSVSITFTPAGGKPLTRTAGLTVTHA